MSFDPFEYQKKMVQEWEKNLSKYMDKTMRDPGFMQLMSRNLGTSLDMQKVVKDQMQKGLQGLSIPTAEDFKKLYLTLNRMETLLLDLEERMQDLEAKQDGGEPGPQVEAAPKTETSARRKKAAAK